MSYSKLISFTLTAFMITACHAENITAAYLAQHPALLKQKFDECQAAASDSKECKMVTVAAAEFSTVEEEYRSDPDKFGFTVLTAENDLAKLKKNYIAAQSSLADLTARHATPAQTKVAQDNIDKARKLFDDKNNAVKVMLAVIGIYSPE